MATGGASLGAATWGEAGGVKPGQCAKFEPLPLHETKGGYHEVLDLEVFTGKAAPGNLNFRRC